MHSLCIEEMLPLQLFIVTDGVGKIQCSKLDPKCALPRQLLALAKSN
jgi:hypothetical protein